MLLGLLSLFIPVSRMVVIFVLRNNKYVDYEAMMRARREAYIRQRQQYQQGGFGSPYGNPNGQNGYGQGTSQPYGNPAQEDPFAEFGTSGNTQNGNTNSGKAEDVFDDIFNWLNIAQMINLKKGKADDKENLYFRLFFALVCCKTFYKSFYIML